MIEFRRYLYHNKAKDRKKDRRLSPSLRLRFVHLQRPPSPHRIQMSSFPIVVGHDYTVPKGDSTRSSSSSSFLSQLNSKQQERKKRNETIKLTFLLPSLSLSLSPSSSLLLFFLNLSRTRRSSRRPKRTSIPVHFRIREGRLSRSPVSCQRPLRSNQVSSTPPPSFILVSRPSLDVRPSCPLLQHSSLPQRYREEVVHLPDPCRDEGDQKPEGSFLHLDHLPSPLPLSLSPPPFSLPTQPGLSWKPQALQRPRNHFQLDLHHRSLTLQTRLHPRRQPCRLRLLLRRHNLRSTLLLHRSREVLCCWIQG